MKKLLVIFLALIGILAIGQDIHKLAGNKPREDFENIWIKKIADDDEQTTFVIWVRKNVALHLHEHHSENIYVLGGKGEMRIADEKFIIKRGDYFNIPKNTPHSLKVLSYSPVKVLSIQSPKFDGTDRILIAE